MTRALSQLAVVIGEEIALGEDLLENLAAQREAILDWKIAALIERIESREALLTSLAAAEDRRKKILADLTATEAPQLSLREIIARAGAGEAADALEPLRQRAEKLYRRLKREENSMLGLMQNLLQHIREAIAPLTRPEVSVYGGGAALPARASSGLIQGKV